MLSSKFKYIYIFFLLLPKSVQSLTLMSSRLITPASSEASAWFVFRRPGYAQKQLVHMCVCAVLRLQRHFGHNLPNLPPVSEVWRLESFQSI